MDVTTPQRVNGLEWRQLRPWNLSAIITAARCHPSSWPFVAIVALKAIRPPLLANTDPGVVVNFTRPVPRALAVVLNISFFVACALFPAIATISFVAWGLPVAVMLVIIAAMLFAVVAIRLNIRTLGAFQGPATMLLLHDFIAAERGTGVPEAALGELLANYDEPIKLTVAAARTGLVNMYTRLGFVPDSAKADATRLVMIRPRQSAITTPRSAVA